MTKEETWIVIGALAVGAYLYGRSRTAAVLPATNLVPATPPGASTSSVGCPWLDYNGVCTSDPSAAWFYPDGTPIGVSNLAVLPNVTPGNTTLIQDALNGNTTGL